MSYTGVQMDRFRTDRAAGVLLAAACGDALGVPYEFAERLTEGQVPEMRGGGLGPYAPGEYSDDTQMAWCVAEVAATGADLRDEAALDRIAANFLRWRREGASDIGNQTRQVLDGLPAGASAAAMRAAAAAVHERTGRSAGNGSLMRTGPVALAYLHDPAALVEAARAVSGLTHHDALAGDACVLWCAGIRHAVLNGTFDGVRGGLDLLPAERREFWSARLAEAEAGPAGRFAPNGFVVAALQAAWSAIVTTPEPAEPAGHLRAALETAVRIGDDTDTVAAIAGALLGARWGAAAVPAGWQEAVHGWPAQRGAELIELSRRTVERS